ncbi:MAG: putative Ig domain-containing protein [Pseudomonadota bacterium]
MDIRNSIRRSLILFFSATSLTGCLTSGGSDDDGATGDGTPGANTPPSITGVPASRTAANAEFSFTPAARDADGDTLSFMVANQPQWAQFNESTGRINGRPTISDVGIYDGIVVSVTDGSDTASLAPFSLEVVATAGNSPPSISGTPPTEVMVDAVFSFTPVASDADGDRLAFEIVNRPPWAQFSEAAGTLVGRPGAGDVGRYEGVVITATDGLSSVSLPPFSVTVLAAGNSPPSIAGSPSTQIAVGADFSFTPSASDPDGDTLSFDIVNRPAWIQFSEFAGTISGTPNMGDVGRYDNITISVSDGVSSASLGPFSVEVIAAGNSSPSIAGNPPARVDANASYAFTPSAVDPDGDPLSFDIVNRPSWAQFSQTTGAITGRPEDGDVGTYGNIVVSVSDGTDSASLGPFSIEVVAVNTPPSISGSPSDRVDANADYSFTPTASDADGDTLSFVIVNRPAWAQFNSSTGAITGRPDANDVGRYRNIVISVSDGTDTASLGPFSIEVFADNTPPTIGGTPPTQIAANSSFSFTPVATDADGDGLSFDIDNQPSWASFDETTGEISGTPIEADVGVYADIVISVNDGSDTASLGPFSVEVVAVGSGTASVTITWTAPTRNEDGSDLTDLAGFTLYYGVQSGTYTEQISIDNPAITSFVVEGLVPGTYYFVATATNSSGEESRLSGEAVKVAGD